MITTAPALGPSLVSVQEVEAGGKGGLAVAHGGRGVGRNDDIPLAPLHRLHPGPPLGGILVEHHLAGLGGLEEGSGLHGRPPVRLRKLSRCLHVAGCLCLHHRASTASASPW